jgi:peroxidase
LFSFSGEVKNKATSFADLSTIYGSTSDESLKIRSFLQGKIMLTPGQTLSVDAEGKFTGISARLSTIISVNTWVVLFGRNHNNIAERLSTLNPSWGDETLYQESRRINIAVFQNLMTSKEFSDIFTCKQTLGSYDSSVDPSCSVEFTQSAARFNHFFIPSFMRLIDERGKITDIPQSDLVGRVDIIDKSFEDSLRGALNQSLNFDGYSDEVI